MVMNMSLEAYNKEGIQRMKGHSSMHAYHIMPSHKKKGKIKEKLDDFIPFQPCWMASCAYMKLQEASAATDDKGRKYLRPSSHKAWDKS